MDKRKRRLLCMLEGGKKYRWIRGVPPLSFKVFAAGTLENYRIYGNTVGGAGVGDLVENGEHAGEYKVAVTISNGTDTLTTPIYLPEQIRKVGDEEERIDYEEQKMHRVRKNLLPNTETSQTINGVTFTVNDDGSVTCNGECVNRVASYHIKNGVKLNDETKQYILTGCPKGGERNSTYVLEYSNAVTQAKTDSGDGVSFTPYRAADYPNAWIRIMIFGGYTCNNLTFYPMVRKADISDDTYEPYIENTDLDVTLPALPTLPGTNVLSVGTAVQPSEIEVKGKIKA